MAMMIEIKLDEKATRRWWNREDFRELMKKRFSGYGLDAEVLIMSAEGLVLDRWGKVAARA
jgi:hypothetical protein